MRDVTAELATQFCSVPGCPDDAHGDDGLCVYHHNLERTDQRTMPVAEAAAALAPGTGIVLPGEKPTAIGNVRQTIVERTVAAVPDEPETTRNDPEPDDGTVKCKRPGCTGTTTVTRGLWARLCTEHRVEEVELRRALRESKTSKKPEKPARATPAPKPEPTAQPADPPPVTGASLAELGAQVDQARQRQADAKTELEQANTELTATTAALTDAIGQIAA